MLALMFSVMSFTLMLITTAIVITLLASIHFAIKVSKTY
jgi:hypothetical protein